MATVASYKQDDEKQGQGQASQQLSSAASSTVGGSGGAQAAANPGSSAGQKGTGYVNVQDYVKKNNADKFGGEVSGRLTGEVDQGREQVGTTYNSFKDQSNSQRITNDKSALERAGQWGNADTLNKAQRSALSKMYNAQYKGPSQLSDISGYQDAVKTHGQASRGLENTKTMGGRKDLLSRYYERPDYNKGSLGLDNAILQNSAVAREQFQNLRDQNQDYAGLVDRYSSDASSLASQNRSYLDNIRNTTRGVFDRRMNEINARAQSDADKVNRKINDAVSARYDNTMSNLRDLRDRGVDVSQYIDRRNANYSAGDALNQTSRDDYHALADIMGLSKRSFGRDRANIGTADDFYSVQNAAIERLRNPQPQGGGSGRDRSFEGQVKRDIENVYDNSRAADPVTYRGADRLGAKKKVKGLW